MSTVTDNEAKRNLSTNLRRMLAERDWSVRDLAERTGDPVMTLHDSISGKALPRGGVLTRLADAFSVRVDDLLSATKEKTRVAP